ncbi:MAG: aspartate-semialdehyde dehydrogenase [Desulfobacterales bacterium]|nr:aspartate-semialdehyde dehydrogenase [Desulfobacterales bacterium]
MEKIKVGIIGATGMVGQNYIKRLDKHPWFTVTYVAASPRSAGKMYQDAVANRWHMNGAIPDDVRKLVVCDANQVDEIKGKCRFVFSALDMDKQAIMDLEGLYAKNHIPVVSNNSAYRYTEDIPVLIPEINSHHIEIIKQQQKNHKWPGFVVVKPNCSVQSYLIPVFALHKAGYYIKHMILSTLQAVSGSGYPGVPSLDILDNIVPYCKGEEEKSEKEPLKILGSVVNNRIIGYDAIKISAHCNRVPVIDGHTACVSMAFEDKKPTIEEIKKIWRDFRSVPQELSLPSAPMEPILYKEALDRPQPRKDRDNGDGMAITLGRLRECNVFDYRFVGLSHNTIRGAAGGGILNAELLMAKGYFDEQEF